MALTWEDTEPGTPPQSQGGVSPFWDDTTEAPPPQQQVAPPPAQKELTWDNTEAADVPQAPLKPNTPVQSPYQEAEPEETPGVIQTLKDSYTRAVAKQLQAEAQGLQ